MKDIFRAGDRKTYERAVIKDDFAAFHGKVVHQVMSTFSLARDIEWTGRQFVLEMRDDDEEGVGTFVHIVHRGPAFEGETVTYTAVLAAVNGNEVVCDVDARVGARLVATARTGQKILKREKIGKIFTRP